MGLKENREKRKKEKIEKYNLLSQKVTSNRINYIVETISKEVMNERKLILQILYTIFSIKTYNPINLFIFAPSGTGKSHVLTRTIKYCPSNDIMQMVDMSDKALMYMEGDLVVKEDDDVYVPLENYTNEIQTKMRQIDDQLDELDPKKSEDVSKKVELSRERRELEDELEELDKEAITRVNLTGKCLIFFDTPNKNIYSILMPLLSHDKERLEYRAVDKKGNKGMKTKVILLEGWPSMITCQAIENEGDPRWIEISRRFYVSNPTLSELKYKSAIKYSFEKHTTEEIYQKTILDDERIEITKAVIFDIMRSIEEYYKNNKRGDIILPFIDILPASFGKSSYDMNISDKLGNYIKLSSIINIKERPKLVTNEGKEIPFCTLEDLKISTELTEFIYGGVRPYVLEWYLKVFLPRYRKISENAKNNNKEESRKDHYRVTRPVGDHQVEFIEERAALSAEELIKTMKRMNLEEADSTTKPGLLKKYINSLVSTGYIEEFDSQINPREKLYVANDMLAAINKYTIDKNGNLVANDKIVLPESEFIKLKEVDYMKNIIENIMKYYPDCYIKDVDGKSISVDDLIDKYYDDLTECFDYQSISKAEKIIEMTDTVREESIPTDQMVINKYVEPKESVKSNAVWCSMCNTKYWRGEEHLCCSDI